MRTLTRVRVAVGVACLAAADPTFAATIYGTIYENGAPVPNADLTLTCPADGSPVPTSTDTRGTYRFTVNTTGRCELVVRRGDAQAATTVILYDDPTPYDFDITGDQLVRR